MSSAINTVTDKFGTPLKNGDFVICKMSGYGNTSEFAVGKIEKLCRLRHQVRKCDNNGNVLMNTYSGLPVPQRARQVDRYNMMKVEVNPKSGTVRAIRKMTL